MEKSVSYEIKGKRYFIMKPIAEGLDLLKQLDYFEIVRLGNEKPLKCPREKIVYKGFDFNRKEHILSLSGKTKSIDVFGTSNLDFRLIKSKIEGDLKNVKK